MKIHGGFFDDALAFRAAGQDGFMPSDICPPLASTDGGGAGIPTVIHTTGAGYWQEGFGTLRGREQDSHENLIAFSCKDHGSDAGEISPTLRSMAHDGSHENGGGQVAVAMNLRGREGGAMPELDEFASLRSASGGSSRSYVVSMAVRRLTPRECERLQGFPDDFTLVPMRKGMMADGPRYKMLGNSMAVPVMRWIGQRVAAVDAIP